METAFQLYNGASSYIHYLASILGDETAEPKRLERKDNLTLAKLALIQNFFILEKEDMVENKGDLVFESKVLDAELEKTVNLIFPKTVNNTYIIAGEEKTAAEVIAIIRNKFAHGDYRIDLKKNLVILQTEPTETHISIKKLTDVVMMAGMTLLKYPKTNKVERIISLNGGKRNHTIKNDADLKSELKKMQMKKYTLTSIDGSEVKQEDLDEFNELIEVIKYYLQRGVDYNEILISYKKKALSKGLTFEAVASKFSIKEINSIIKFISTDDNFYESAYYESQARELNALMIELKAPDYNKESFFAGTMRNLVLISHMEYYKTFDINKLQSTLTFNKIGVEEFVSAMTSQFLTLYETPLDTHYIKEKYNPNREGMLDFSLLDLSRFKPSKISIYDTPLTEIRKKVAGYRKGLLDANNELEYAQTNLEKSKKANSNDGIAHWESVIILKEKEIMELYTALFEAEADLLIIEEDYANNSKYFENRAIIEGIRNSIAHGNVRIKKFYSKTGKLRDHVINFKNIYKGELKFELNIRIEDFLMLFRETNVGVINDYFESLEPKKQKRKVRR